MDASKVKFGQKVVVGPFDLLGIPRCEAEVVERRALDWFNVKFANGETMAVHASDMTDAEQK